MGIKISDLPPGPVELETSGVERMVISDNGYEVFRVSAPEAALRFMTQCGVTCKTCDHGKRAGSSHLCIAGKFAIDGKGDDFFCRNHSLLTQPSGSTGNE